MVRTHAFPLFALVPLLAPACSQSSSVSTTEQHLNGIEGMFEYTIDLPWRMEPRPAPPGAGQWQYDPVPITIAINDEDTASYSLLFQPSGTAGPPDVIVPHLGDLCRVTVGEMNFEGDVISTQEFHVEDLDWIDLSGADPNDPNRPTWWPLGGDSPWHGTCHPRSEDCSRFQTIRDTSEWHAQLRWDHGFRFPDSHAVLELVAYVSKEPGTCDDERAEKIALRTYGRAFFAPAPLPRFGDDRWLYGDLHYHSQSTDNEGESGHAYRAVATTLAAMGVDFVYATDHASDSEQIVDIDVDLDGESRRGLRDMNQARWDFAQSILAGPDGANQAGADAALAVGQSRLPRVFLGAEVDVIPVVPDRPLPERYVIEYGNGKTYNLEDYVCRGWLGINFACQTEFGLDPFVDENGLDVDEVHDTQGLDTIDTSRQHLLYLPRFSDEPSGLVASRTHHYGGASRKLPSVLDEIDSKHGLAFLAHPLYHHHETVGPGMVPYTQYQYDQIFAHPAFAGLQLWNEDARSSSSSGDFHQFGYELFNSPLHGLPSSGNPGPGYFGGHFDFVPVAGLASWLFDTHLDNVLAFDLHNGTAQWDRLLRWGLDLDRTRPIEWLEPGEPRKLFMAGGSDAHGDFNFRREGYMTEFKQVTDDAIAKVRNLVDAGKVRGACHANSRTCDKVDPAQPGASQDQVAEALGEGRFSVTDGPALRIAVDRNSDGKVDDRDYGMGETVELFDVPGRDEKLPIIVEYESTSEFGFVEQIDLYVGVDIAPEDNLCGNGDLPCPPSPDRGRTYAPPGHGVRDPNRDQPGIGCASPSTPPCRLDDGYWLSAGPSLSFPIPSAEGPHHFRVELDLADFPVGAFKPSRVYVRAFARTRPPCTAITPSGPHTLGCVARYAYSNPVWALRTTLTAPVECPFSDRAIDRDYDGIPDTCDLQPDQPSGDAWTRLFGGPSTTDGDTATATVIDAAGNVFVAGAMYDNGRIEGDPAAFVANGRDGVIIKYSPTGAYLTKRALPGTGTMVINDIALANDVIYVVGTSKGSQQVGSSPWTSTTDDPFIVRLRASDLEILGAKQLAGTGAAEGRAISVVGGQVAITGSFSGTLTPSLGAFPAEGISDCYVAFYNADLSSLQSIQLVRGLGACDARSIAVGLDSSVTAAFNYTNSIVVGPSTPLRNVASTPAVAVARYGTPAQGRAPRWATYLGGGSTGNAGVGALAVDATNNVTVVGSFAVRLPITPAFGPSTVRTSAGSDDGFIVRLDDSGFELPVAVPRVGGAGSEKLTSVALDALGEAVVAGEFTSSPVSIGTQQLVRTTGSIRDYFTAWLSPTGAVDLARGISSFGGVVLGKIAISANGDHAALASTFWGQARFDDRRTVTPIGSYDGAVTRLPGPRALTSGP